MDIDTRLQEMGNYLRVGGTSDGFSDSKLFERLIEGGAGGTPGSRIPNVMPWVLARVAETARAVLALREDDQRTVMACYCDGLAHREQQAAVLNIRVSALQKRLKRIRLLLEDWLTDAARERRRVERREHEAQANLAASDARDEQVRATAARVAKERETRRTARLERARTAQARAERNGQPTA